MDVQTDGYKLITTHTHTYNAIEFNCNLLCTVQSIISKQIPTPIPFRLHRHKQQNFAIQNSLVYRFFFS